MCRTFLLLFVVLLGLEYVFPKLKCWRFHPQTSMLMVSGNAVSGKCLDVKEVWKEGSKVTSAEQERPELE